MVWNNWTSMCVYFSSTFFSHRFHLSLFFQGADQDKPLWYHFSGENNVRRISVLGMLLIKQCKNTVVNILMRTSGSKKLVKLGLLPNFSDEICKDTEIPWSCSGLDSFSTLYYLNHFDPIRIAGFTYSHFQWVRKFERQITKITATVWMKISTHCLSSYIKMSLETA